MKAKSAAARALEVLPELGASEPKTPEKQAETEQSVIPDQAVEEKPAKKKGKEPAPAPVIVISREVPTVEELVCELLKSSGATPTNVQRGACRAADGRALSELWRDDDVRKAFGGKRPPWGKGKKPRTFCFLASTRGGKSIVAAGCAVRSSLTCSVSKLVPSDELRFPCLATSLDTADQIHAHALWMVRRHFPGSLVGRPLTSSFQVAREGHPWAEITTTPLAARGASVVGRWLAGIVFDEAPLMGTAKETVRSLRASRRAVADRILPGGQELLIGSPDEPHGEVYDLYEERFGEPDVDLVIVNADGPMLNPEHWTPEFLAELERKDPWTYQTKGLAKFADAPSTLIPTVAIKAAMGSEVARARRRVPPNAQPGEKWTPVEYVASLGSAERGPGWSLVIVGTVGEDNKKQKILEQAVSQQWFGSVAHPLQPRAVLKEARDLCLDYGVDVVHMNQSAVDTYQEIAGELGLGLVGEDLEGAKRTRMCDTLRGAIVESRFSLTSNKSQKTDLQRVKKHPTVNGITVHYPSSGESSDDAESTACDFVPLLGMCVLNAAEAPVNITARDMDPIDLMMGESSGDAYEQACEAVLG
jgi:hypothetical protein